MNGAQLHLALNHLPVIGTLIALLVLAAGMALRNETVRRTALVLLVGAGLAAGGAFLTGEPAEEVIDYRLLLFGVFSHPQVAMVGASQEKLRQQGIPFVEASYPFNDHGMSMVMGETDGFVRMLGHAETGEILGACVVGPKATELIHEVVVAMHHRTTARDFITIPHYHPTLSEIWTYPAEEIADQVAGHS